MKRLWKESASLIILARHSANILSWNPCNYTVRSAFSEAVFRSQIFNLYSQVLTLQRPPVSSYPEAVCFPGGVTENADHVDDWIKFYKKSGVNESDLVSLTKKKPNGRPFIFQPDANTAISRQLRSISSLIGPTSSNSTLSSLFQGHFSALDSDSRDIRRSRHSDLQNQKTVARKTSDVQNKTGFRCGVLAERGISRREQFSEIVSRAGGGAGPVEPARVVRLAHADLEPAEKVRTRCTLSST